MEKQGMDRGRHPGRPGLLALLLPLSLLCALPSRLVPAQEAAPEEALSLEIQFSPRTPVLRSPWTLSILVDHPEPSEVTVRPPPFPEALSLDQVRTSLRLVRDSRGGERRLSAVEYVFIPRIPGPVTLAPFEVLVPGKKALSSEISFRIPGSAPASPPRYYWSAPSYLTAGEEAELRLRVEGGGEEALSPRYQPEPPENAVLEVLPAGEKDQSEGIALRLRVLPLDGKEFVLPPFRLSQGGLEIPGLRIALRPSPSPAEKAPAPPPDPVSAGEELPAAPDLPPPFPESRAGIFPPLRGACEQVIGAVRKLWEGGERARALAEIRRNEGESAFGPAFRPLRREMEAALGLEPGPDEPWRPQKPPLLVLPGALILMSLLTGGRMLRLRSLRRGKSVTLFSSRVYSGVMAFLLTGLILAVLTLVWGALGRGGEGAVATRQAELHRIPDSGGALEYRLDEGLRVTIRAGAGSGPWVHVETPEGVNGWVRREALIFY